MDLVGVIFSGRWEVGGVINNISMWQVAVGRVVVWGEFEWGERVEWGDGFSLLTHLVHPL
eukprot:scaffold20295_cov45-Cyclotella_meneghiniana.AAC.1